MLRRATIVACALILASAGAQIASATTYSFVQLPAVGTDTGSLGLAVNTVNGVPEVAGRSTTVHPTWYNRGNGAIFGNTGAGTKITADISGATYASATAIDTNGDVVGASYGTNYSAFYLPAGSNSATILPNLSSSTATYNSSNAYGTNAAGQVVGYSVASDGNYHAAVWAKSGSSWSVTDLGSSGSASCANAINASGVIAGQITNNGFTDAATWTYNGSAWVATDLVNRSLTTQTTGSCFACAINDNGVAVGGGSVAGFPSFDTHAMEFNANGTITSLGALYGSGSGAIVNQPFPLSQIGSSDCAMGINDSGVIVGESAINSAGTENAFIYGYQGNNTMQNMNTVFAAIIPANWTLVCATGIDNNGDIVGVAANASGYDEGFLMSLPVPEPSALLLTATGLVGVLTYVWRRRK